MTTLDEVLKVVDTLSKDELRVLQDYVEQRQREASGSSKSARLNAVLDAMREGLSEEDLDEIEWAMNVEYVDPPEKHDLHE